MHKNKYEINTENQSYREHSIYLQEEDPHNPVSSCASRAKERNQTTPNNAFSLHMQKIRPHINQICLYPIKKNNKPITDSSDQNPITQIRQIDLERLPQKSKPILKTIAIEANLLTEKHNPEAISPIKEYKWRNQIR